MNQSAGLRVIPNNYGGNRPTGVIAKGPTADVRVIGGFSDQRLAQVAPVVQKQTVRERAVSKWGKPPPNYVPGVGRGLSISANIDGSGLDGGGRGDKWKRAFQEKNERKLAEQQGLGMDQDGREITSLDDAKSLFHSKIYDTDDKEADSIYEAIDEYMDTKKRLKNKNKIAGQESLADLKQMEEEQTIQAQFSDLKRNLTDVSHTEWNNIPVASDGSIKRIKYESFSAVPDNLLESARLEKEKVNTIDSRETKKVYTSGFETVVSGYKTPSKQNLTAVGQAREQMLSVNLDKAGDQVTGQTVVDPKGYLTDMRSMHVSSATEVSDIKKTRSLMKSVITTNPRLPSGWIAAARLEEAVGKMIKARALIAEGCEVCPTSEDIWLEASRLQPPEEAKGILTQAALKIPTSVRIWLAACELEVETKNKRAVLRKALTFVPTSIKIWKAAIELEDHNDAKIMLARAVECVPQSADMWLALARLETFERAKQVLNKARQALPTEKAIWLCAAKLQEANGNDDAVIMTIKKGIESLTSHGVEIRRDDWIHEAYVAEDADSLLTCQAIIDATITLGVDEEDRKATWTEDAAQATKKGHVVTARAIYAHTLTVFRKSKALWALAADLEVKHGNFESLDLVLRKAVECCPKEDSLWLLWTKSKWEAGKIDDARETLSNAFAANPDSDAIWLAAAELEMETGNIERARKIFERARSKTSSKRVWMKSAILERSLGNEENEMNLIGESIAMFPDFDKLYLMMGQLLIRQNKHNDAREVYRNGLRNIPKSINLWLAVSSLECSLEDFPKARSVMEKARNRIPGTPALWVESIKVELQAGRKERAEHLLTLGQQELPLSGMLWALAVEMAPRAKQKTRSVDALKKCNHDPFVFLAIARLFCTDRKVDKARTWFNRTVKLDPDFGDAWASLLKFEREQNNEKNMEQAIVSCEAAAPRHGYLWQKVAKDPRNAKWSTRDVLLAVEEQASADIKPF